MENRDIYQVVGEICNVKPGCLKPGECEHFALVSVTDPGVSLRKCYYCHSDIGTGGVILLPNWIPTCRKHARRMVLREQPSKKWITVVPRNTASTCWCITCNQSINWEASLLSSSIKSLPVPTPMDSIDSQELNVVSVSNAVAEFRAWHSFTLPISVVSYLPSITPYFGIFCPVTGFDPEGTDTPWIISFYVNLLTASASLPNAVPLKVGGEFTVVDCGKESDKWVNGFVLTSDEDDASGEVLAGKLVELKEKFPWYNLTPRHVYNAIDEEWLTAIVPSVSGSDTVIDLPAPVSTESCDYSPSIEDNSDTISQVSSEEEQATENMRGWAAFFMSAYKLAIGIFAVGKLADSGIDLTSPEAAEVLLERENQYINVRDLEG